MVQFIDLWRAHPANVGTAVACNGEPREAVVPAGAAVQKTVPPNPSAAQIGIALRRAGLRIENFPSRIATCRQHDKAEMHFLYPRQVAEALRRTRMPGFGEMETITGGDVERFHVGIIGRTGVIYVRDYWQRPTDIEGRPTGDLIDLWNGYRTTDSWLMDWMAWTGYQSPYAQAGEIWFWPVP